MPTRARPSTLPSFVFALGLVACNDDTTPADSGADEVSSTATDTASDDPSSSTDASTGDGSTDASSTESTTSTTDGTTTDGTTTDGTTGDPIDTAAALFEPGMIAEFDIELSEAAIAVLAVDAKLYVTGNLTATINGEVFELTDIAVRLKGNYGSFRTLDQKAGFLLNFDRYVADQNLLGLEKLAVNNMVQDPSMEREVLGYRLFREAGIPASRAGHAVVTVNGEPYGLYTLVETTDNRDFLDHWFGDHDGAIYEGAYGSDLYLDWLTSYDQDNGGVVDYADILELITALDGMTDPDTFVADVDQVIDLDMYLTYQATDLYLGDWDGYPWSRNNYFMIRRTSDSRWVFMPWGIDQLMVDHLPPFEGGGRLAQMCAASLECRQMLAAKYEEVVQRVEDLGLASEAQTIADAVYEAALADPRREYGIDLVVGTVAANIDFLTNRGPQLLGALICTDPSLVDDDNDGYNGCGEDCNDGNPAVHPGAVEVCDYDDDNCNGQWDDNPMCPQCIVQDLPDPELGNVSYCFNLKTWAEAEADCVVQGGHLMAIHNQELQDYLSGAAFSISGSDWWIGLNDQSQEGSFGWTDGTPLDFTSWAGGEPNNSGEEDCGHLAAWGGGAWNDLNCAAANRYICHLP